MKPENRKQNPGDSLRKGAGQERSRASYGSCGWYGRKVPFRPVHTARSNPTTLTVQNFRRDCLRELKKIKMAWAELNYTTAPGVLILLPSTPAIPPSSDSQRLVE